MLLFKMTRMAMVVRMAEKENNIVIQNDIVTSVTSPVIKTTIPAAAHTRKQRKLAIEIKV